MDDRVSREAKLNAAKEIVNTYIRSSVVKTGENSKLELTPKEICSVFKEVFATINDTVPSVERKVGLG